MADQGSSEGIPATSGGFQQYTPSPILNRLRQSHDGQLAFGSYGSNIPSTPGQRNVAANDVSSSSAPVFRRIQSPNYPLHSASAATFSTSNARPLNFRHPHSIFSSPTTVLWSNAQQPAQYVQSNPLTESLTDTTQLLNDPSGASDPHFPASNLSSFSAQAALVSQDPSALSYGYNNATVSYENGSVCVEGHRSSRNYDSNKTHASLGINPCLLSEQMDNNTLADYGMGLGLDFGFDQSDMPQLAMDQQGIHRHEADQQEIQHFGIHQQGPQQQWEYLQGMNQHGAHQQETNPLDDPVQTHRGSLASSMQSSSFYDSGLDYSATSTTNVSHLNQRQSEYQSESGTHQTHQGTMLPNEANSEATDSLAIPPSSGVQNDDNQASSGVEVEPVNVNHLNNDLELEELQDDDVFQEYANDEHIRPLMKAAENSFQAFRISKNVESNTENPSKAILLESKDSYKAFKDIDHQKTKTCLLRKLQEANQKSQRPTKFASLEDAKQALTRKSLELDAANDPTIPRTDLEKQTYVAELVKAMGSFARARDDEKVLGTWRKRYNEHPDLVEYRCWVILEDQIKVHTQGALSCFETLDVDKEFGKSRSKQFADRLACIYQSLQFWKAQCKGMTDPTRLEKLVHGPFKQEKAATDNWKTNKKKGKDLKEVNERRKSKMPSGTSQPDQYFEGFPSLSTGNSFQGTPNSISETHNIAQPAQQAQLHNPAQSLQQELQPNMVQNPPLSSHLNSFANSPQGTPGSDGVALHKTFQGAQPANVIQALEQQPQLDMAPRHSLYLYPNSTPPHTSSETSSPGQPNTSQAPAKVGAGTKRKIAEMDETAQPLQTDFRIEVTTPEGMAQPRKKSVGRPPKRAKKANDDPKATKYSQFATPPSDMN
ncbi:hypothetical protein BJX64DRAFT_202735 [Aspergillus heterothallicus]